MLPTLAARRALGASVPQPRRLLLPLYQFPSTGSAVCNRLENKGQFATGNEGAALSETRGKSPLVTCGPNYPLALRIKTPKKSLRVRLSTPVWLSLAVRAGSLFACEARPSSYQRLSRPLYGAKIFPLGVPLWYLLHDSVSAQMASSSGPAPSPSPLARAFSFSFPA